MRVPPILRRWAALGALGGVLLAGLWILVIQVLLVLFSPIGTWQVPKVAHVVVLRIERDPEKTFTDQLVVRQGEQERTLEMLKEEMAGLHPDDEFWILDNYFYTSLRPAQFRLTPLRLALEYPLPLMLLAAWAFGRILRSRWGLAPEPVLDPDKPRQRLQDDFHHRAERFRPPEGS